MDTFSVRLSEMSGRLDASYHVPIVNAIVEHLRQHAEEVTTVGDSRISREVILPGRFKRVYVDEGMDGYSLVESNYTNSTLQIKVSLKCSPWRQDFKAA